LVAGACEFDVVSDRPLPPRVLEVLEGYRVAWPEDGGSGWELARRARVYINWFRPVTREMLGDPGCLRLIIARSSGYDHIDVEAAAERGVCVANQPELIAESVAESAVAGILGALRMIVRGHEYVEKWAVDGWPVHLQGSLVRGRSVGLLGAGRIGVRVAHILAALGAGPFYYYARGRNRGLEQVLGARRLGLEDLFSRSSILVNSLPLTRETRGIVTYRLLSSMPRGAVYVNVGRGGTEEPGAVCRVARERPDMYFYLDVHPVEPLPPGHERLVLAREHRNVVLTPHFAGYSRESALGTSLLAALQARAFLEEGCVWNPVGGPCGACRGGPPGVDEVIRLVRGWEG